MDPTPMDEAQAYWAKALAGAAAGDRVVLGAFTDGRLQGTVTVFLDTPPNQPFRAEIWKLMVAPAARRNGVARQLMLAAEALAAEKGRTLLNLDTATEGGAAELYESLGWVRAGVIPDYAYKPKGGLTGTAIYYKRVGAA
jgi:ribosomal protein S18 acetylase RimI-like enzyme